MNINTILLAGPTAAGKSALAVALSQFLPVEIISIDSALVYRGLNIGTAKPTQADMLAIPHHLIDIKSPLEQYSVAECVYSVKLLITEIQARGKLALLVGGTMMYFKVLMDGINIVPPTNYALRQQLAQEIAHYGNLALYARLQQLDPIAANKINVHDSQRLQRALEICLSRPMAVDSNIITRQPCLAPNSYIALSLQPPRNLLYQRINARFLTMLENGLIAEVEQLLEQYPTLTANHAAMRCVGYQQVWQYLAGIINANQLLEYGQTATRHLAKRQLTWLKTLNFSPVDNTVTAILTALQAHHILLG
jgi:tRNA dimethylallyltransferase